MQTRFLRVIIAEREKRHQEISLINKEKELIAYERRNLELEKKQLDYEQRNLETRLAEVDKYRDILPSTKYLREMGVDFHEITIWIETIRDKAATEGIDHKSAISLIVQDLKLYNQLSKYRFVRWQLVRNVRRKTLTVQTRGHGMTFVNVSYVKECGIANRKTF